MLQGRSHLESLEGGDTKPQFVVFLHHFSGRPPYLGLLYDNKQAMFPSIDDSDANADTACASFFTAKLALVCLIHTKGGSWDEIPFRRNTGDERKHNKEWLTWVPVLHGLSYMDIPSAQTHTMLTYRDINWMGVPLGLGNMHSCHPGHMAPPPSGQPRDNSSNPTPPGPRWDANDSYTRCDYGCKGDTTTYHTEPSQQDGADSVSCKL